MSNEVSADPRRRAEAAERNKEPILRALQSRLPARGTVLEVASGTGEHAVFLAHHFPRLTWQPSERDPAMLSSIAAWRERPGFRPGPVENLRAPIPLDLGDPAWPGATLAAARFPVAVVAVNLLHVAPWRVAENLFAGAGELLVGGRMLFVYGPFLVAGKHTSPGNASFDRTLRKENSDWGLRDVADLEILGEANQLELAEVVEMPVNNRSLVFRRR